METSTEVLIHLLEKLTVLHDLADKKSYISLAIIGTTLTLSPQYIVTVINNTATMHTFWQLIIYLLVLAFLITSILGIYSIVRTLVPRTVSSKSSIVFWGHAAKEDLTVLQNEWKTQTDDEINERLVIEYHSNAAISVKKFQFAKLSIYFATCVIILFFVIVMSSLNFDNKSSSPKSQLSVSVEKQK